MKITITAIALSVLWSGVSFSQEIERPRLAERGTTKKQAVVKIGLIKRGLDSSGVNRPKRVQKPEIPKELQAQKDAVKDLQKALQAEINEKVNELGKDATREDIKATVESFKENNQGRIEELRNDQASIREELEANRPEKPVRPELNDELKAKVNALQTKREEMRDANKVLRENLKEASKEDRKEMITAYREENKVKHQEIKTQAQEVKEEIRSLFETEVTRTSDL
jgi:chromosome segregation ATPase